MLFRCELDSVIKTLPALYGTVSSPDERCTAVRFNTNNVLQTKTAKLIEGVPVPGIGGEVEEVVEEGSLGVLRHGGGEELTNIS